MLLILAWLPAVLGAAPGEIPRAADLAADARGMRRGQIPMLVLYSQADCHWCEQVKRDHLLPLQRDPAARVILRQIDLDSDAPLVDFAGRLTTHRAYARGEGARVTPTLAVYGADGRRLAEPLVGVRIPDFYGSYIERLIAEGANQMTRHGKQ